MKKILLTIFVAVVLVAVWWFLYKREVSTVMVPTGTEVETEEKIVQELNTVDIGDLDTEFQSIDKELNQL